jgi:hypothetical protein
MSLKQIFSDLSDGIVIINDDADVTYFNQPAAQLIAGDTLDTIGLPTLQRMLHLIIAGELTAPVKFTEKVFPDTEYAVKIVQMYSFYVVEFVETKSPNNYEALKRNAVQMVSDKLSKKLAQLSQNLESLSIALHDDTKDLSPPLIHDTLGQSRSLQFAITELEHLADLYLKEPIDTYTSIEPLAVIKTAVSQLESQCLQKGIKIKIRQRRQANVNLYCNVSWMSLAIAECLLKLIELSERQSVLLVKMDVHGNFMNVVMERAATELGDEAALEDEVWLDYPSQTDALPPATHECLSFDFLMAERVFRLHGGGLKVTDSADGQRFIIELPVGFNPQLEQANYDQQLKIYAEDLAKLQARQNRLKTV